MAQFPRGQVPYGPGSSWGWFQWDGTKWVDLGTAVVNVQFPGQGSYNINGYGSLTTGSTTFQNQSYTYGK